MREFNNTAMELGVSANTWSTLVQRARMPVIKALAHQAQYEYSYEMGVEVDQLVANYLNFLKEDKRFNKWRILQAEKIYEVPINSDYSMPLQIDLLIQDIKTGEHCIVDYKTCYDFWPVEKFNLSPQIPKYVMALRIAGVRVDKMIIEQVRYRSLKEPTFDKLYRTTEVKPSATKIRNIMREHIKASEDIVAHRAKSMAERESESIHSLGRQCDYCDMKELCITELDGGDTSILLQTEYNKDQYTYNAEVEYETELI